MIGSAAAQSSKTKPASVPTIKPGTNKSFGPLKQIDAGRSEHWLCRSGSKRWSCGYSSTRLALRHSQLHRRCPSAGFDGLQGDRSLCARLRHDALSSNDTLRNGQPSALAVDIIAFMDALKIEKATLAGFDWGARTANIIAVLWPERCKAMVSVSGYLIGSQEIRQDAVAAKE